MRELSGFGGGYEECCRRMVVKGVEWLGKNKDAKLSVKSFKNVVGITETASKDAKALEKAFTKGEDDITGAMIQMTWEHLFFIKRKGWDEFTKQLKDAKVREELEK